MHLLCKSESLLLPRVKNKIPALFQCWKFVCAPSFSSASFLTSWNTILLLRLSLDIWSKPRAGECILWSRFCYWKTHKKKKSLTLITPSPPLHRNTCTQTNKQTVAQSSGNVWIPKVQRSARNARPLLLLVQLSKSCCPTGLWVYRAGL